jgi:hypothetical protein
MSWTAEPLVRISVVEDHGVIPRLIAWLMAERIAPEQDGGVLVSGRYVGYFSPVNAKLVKAWLAAQPEFRQASSK